MGRRIIFLTETISSVSSIQSTLLKLDYEVMVAKNILTNTKDDLYFLIQNFDLVIYQQSVFKPIDETFLHNLTLLRKPVMIMTFEEERCSKSIEVPNFKIVSYSLSIGDLIKEIEQLFLMKVKLEEPDLQANATTEVHLSMAEMKKQALPFEQIKQSFHHTYYLGDHILKINQVEISLSYREYQVLRCLVQSEDHFFSNEDFYQVIWGDHEERNRQPHLSLLIKKIKTKIYNNTNIQTPFILNKRGMGYFLNSQFVEVKEESPIVTT